MSDAMTTDAKDVPSVRALQRIRELSADVNAWVAWSVDGALLEAYPDELLDHIDTLTRERDKAREERENVSSQLWDCMNERDGLRAERDEANADKAKRDEAIVGYGRSVILNAYATHVNEYRLTRPEYAETLMREVLVNVDRYMGRDAARTADAASVAPSATDVLFPGAA